MGYMPVLDRAHLEIVRAVELHGSLTAAAKKLHLTQSALSHAVRKLEEQLGLPVWHREGRSLRLTQAGDYLLAAANRLLPQIEHVEERDECRVAEAQPDRQDEDGPRDRPRHHLEQPDEQSVAFAGLRRGHRCAGRAAQSLSPTRL